MKHRVGPVQSTREEPKLTEWVRSGVQRGLVANRSILPPGKLNKSALESGSLSTMRRSSALKRIMLLVAIVSFSTLTLAAEDAASKNPAPGALPGLDRIKADASRQFVHTEEGLPVIRDFASYPSVDEAVVNSSVRAGDLLVLNVTLVLTDQVSGEKRNYMTSSRMTYRETDGGWALQTVEQTGIRDAGPFARANDDDC